MRIFKVSRFLRLLKSAKNLKVLLKTVIISLPSLVNVGVLLILMFFIYSVIGVNLWGNVCGHIYILKGNCGILGQTPRIY